MLRRPSLNLQSFSHNRLVAYWQAFKNIGIRVAYGYALVSAEEATCKDSKHIAYESASRYLGAFKCGIYSRLIYKTKLLSDYNAVRAIRQGMVNIALDRCIPRLYCSAFGQILQCWPTSPYLFLPFSTFRSRL